MPYPRSRKRCSSAPKRSENFAARIPEGSFRLDPEVASQVGHREQQVAQLLLDAVTSALSAIAASHLGQFLLDLAHHVDLDASQSKPTVAARLPIR